MRIMLPFGSIGCIRFNGYNLNSVCRSTPAFCKDSNYFFTGISLTS